MHWEKSGESNLTVFTATIDGPLDEATSIEIWEHFIREVIPLNANTHWDQIAVEIWNDSGRMIMYPKRIGISLRIEAALSQVVVFTVLNEFEELVANDADDDEMTAALSKTRHTLAKLITDAARELKVADLLSNESIPIIVFSYGNEDVVSESVIQGGIS